LRLPWAAQRWRSDHAARVAELLALVRLPGFEARSARHLSGGEAQRVALARALAAQPQALLLDEPLSALDAPTRAALQEDLRAVVLGSGVPALVVTHDLAEARALADRLVVIVNGQVVVQGGLADVLATPPTAASARLLGWASLLPVKDVRARRDATVMTLSRGQPLALHGVDLPTIAPGGRYLLALRPDRLLMRKMPSDETRALNLRASAQTALTGKLASVTDMGAYYQVRIAIADVPEESAVVTLTCSPREWATAALALGDPVAVSIPADAARLVAE